MSNKLSPDDSSPPALVSIENLHHCYKGASAPALSDINLRIHEGSCYGLLGPNGSGKTTLISLLTGLLTPQRGRIHVAQYSLPEQVDDIKKLSALVPQEYAFYPSLTGRENLQFFAGLYQIPAAQKTSRLDYCISACGLEQVLDKRSSTYSGGIKRRLNLALGLLSNPHILYLDEPTVGIDAQSRNFILQTIEQLNAEGMTIVYTSHYMEEVEQICDVAAIIDNGRVLLQEPMNKLLQGGRQLVVTPAKAPTQSELNVLAQCVDATWFGSHLTMNPKPGQTAAQLLTELERAGIEIDKLSMGSHRLEEVYLGATHHELRP